MALHIFTVASDEERAGLLLKTAAKCNVELTVLLENPWRGYICKTERLLKELEALPADDIVCVIDAYDVLINSSEEEILRHFQRYGADIVFGAELNAWPPEFKGAMYSLPSHNNYKYLNAGGYIGYVGAIQKMFRWRPISDIVTVYGGNDQAYMTEYHLRGLGATRLDSDCKIFQNMHWVGWNELEFRGGAMHNRIMETAPCFIHFNGGVWQTDKKENIMPVFVSKMEESKYTSEMVTLSDYHQIVTETCWPHPQK